jgi:hypothetical protein
MGGSMSDNLPIPHPTTGEVLDLSTASTGQLARVISELGYTRQRLAEFERTIEDALLGHMDREAMFTLHVDDGDSHFEVKAPSPTAGTTVYPVNILEVELDGLVQAGTITPDAASRALHRRLILELGCPWDADPRDLARQVKEALSIEVGGVTVRVERAEAKVTPVASAIAALRKVGGTIDALEKAKRDQPPGKRKVTVKATP